VSDAILRMSAWELPVLPTITYVFYFLSENGFLDKKADVHLFTAYQAILDL